MVSGRSRGAQAYDGCIVSYSSGRGSMCILVRTVCALGTQGSQGEGRTWNQTDQDPISPRQQLWDIRPLIYLIWALVS